jgi:hypothetical protein
VFPSSGRWGASAQSHPGKGPQPRNAVRRTTSCRADLMTVSGQLVVVSGEFLVAADTRRSPHPRFRPFTAGNVGGERRVVRAGALRHHGQSQEPEIGWAASGFATNGAFMCAALYSDVQRASEHVACPPRSVAGPQPGGVEVWPRDIAVRTLHGLSRETSIGRLGGCRVHRASTDVGLKHC